MTRHGGVYEHSSRGNLRKPSLAVYPGRRRGGTNLSNAADTARHSVPARRGLGCHRSSMGRQDEIVARHGRRRKHRRRRRRNGSRDCFPCAARRLHYPAREQQHHGDQSHRRQVTCLMTQLEASMRFPSRARHSSDRHQSYAAGSDIEGACGLRQAQSGQTVVRNARRRQLEPSDRRAVQIAYRFPGYRPCALSRSWPRNRRPDWWANSNGDSGGQWPVTRISSGRKLRILAVTSPERIAGRPRSSDRQRSRDAGADSASDDLVARSKRNTERDHRPNIVGDQEGLG